MRRQPAARVARRHDRDRLPDVGGPEPSGPRSTDASCRHRGGGTNSGSTCRVVRRRPGRARRNMINNAEWAPTGQHAVRHGGVTLADCAASFERINDFVDTADFDLTYLINLWYGYRDLLPADVRARDGTRCGRSSTGSPSRTRRAHRREVLLVREPPDHLPHPRVPGGPGLPDDTFSNDGNTGAWHMRARRVGSSTLARREGAIRLHRVALRRLLPEGRDAAADAGRVGRRRELAERAVDGARPRPLRRRAARSRTATSVRRTAGRT